MHTYYSDYEPPAAPVAPREDDYEEIMKKLTNLPKKDFGDLFAESNLTPFFTALVGDEVVSKLREEYVSWSDVKVGTIRETMDLGIPSDTAKQVKTTLNAIYRSAGGRNIEALSLDDLASIEIKSEDVAL